MIILANSDAANMDEMREKFAPAAVGRLVICRRAGKHRQSAIKIGSQIEGTWEIDLRPIPNSQPYLKEFVISNFNGKNFSGVFYGSEFTGGEINGNWERIYLAFITGDKDSSYYHSGYVEGEKFYGISYSPERKFLTP